MKKTLISVALLGILVSSAYAAEPPKPPRETGENFEQKKAEVLKTLEKRLATMQESKACVQAAKNHDELRACREKVRAEMEGAREQMKEHRGEMRERMAPK